jgi:hypothetical protein
MIRLVQPLVLPRQPKARTARVHPRRSGRVWAESLCCGVLVWAGVDVGGRKKGFHVAVVDHRSLQCRPQHLQSPQQVVTWLRALSPRLIAVDSPRSAAVEGALSRECERALAREVCGIRYTPNQAILSTNDPINGSSMGSTCTRPSTTRVGRPSNVFRPHPGGLGTTMAARALDLSGASSCGSRS